MIPFFEIKKQLCSDPKILDQFDHDIIVYSYSHSGERS